MTARYTNLPLRSIFIPFAHRVVEYLAADLSERRSDFLVGEPVIREPAQSLPPETVIEVITPARTRLRPGVERDGVQVRILVNGLEDPGAYVVVDHTQNDQPLDAFAVNCDPTETETTPILSDELRRRWEGYNLVFIGPGQSLEEIVSQTRYGTEIRSAFLWAVVVLFFFEMFVARTRRRDLPEGEVAGGDIPRAVTASSD
jgi:hypothetical protein